MQSGEYQRPGNTIAVEQTAVAHSVTELGAADSVRARSSDTYIPHIPGFQQFRRIGGGGQGVVFEALQQRPRRPVAIKLLHEGAFASAAQRRRFEREIDIIAQLKHPHIVDVHAAGETPEGHHYFVMEFVAGPSLRDYVRQRTLRLEQLLALFVAICEGVQFAHQRGVIHRDLKPANILIDQDRQPKIVDFGLARQLTAGAEGNSVSLSEQIVGTLPYMAPEQAHGDASLVDTRSDVYALGIILYELLTGTYPYPVTGQVLEVARHIAKTPPTRPSRVWSPERGADLSQSRTWLRRAPIPHDLETIVLKALAKEPARRYQSAGELVGDVRRYLAGEPIEAKRDSTWYVLRKLVRRNFRAAVGVAALLAIAGSAATFVFESHWRAEAAQTDQEAMQQVVTDMTDDLSRLSTDKLRPLIVQQSFGWFLLDWQAGRDEAARALRDRFAPGSAERLAADYLCDAEMTAADLRAAIPAPRRALAEFVIGVRAEQEGRLATALAAYEQATRSPGSDWVIARAQDRCRALRATATPPQAAAETTEAAP